MSPYFPQYFAIKRDKSNPLWIKFEQWIEEKFNYKSHGLEFLGINENGGFCMNEAAACSMTVPIISLSQWDEQFNRRTPGKPRKDPRRKYSIDISIAVLTQAKSKHPDLHRKIVVFIQELAKDDQPAGESTAR